MAKAKLIAAGSKVWAAVIHHKHGENVYVAGTKKGLFAELFEFVKAWWATELGEGTPMPKSHTKAVDQYFQHMEEYGREYYTLARTRLGT